MSTPCGRTEICDFEEGLYFLAPCGDRELLLLSFRIYFGISLTFETLKLVQGDNGVQCSRLRRHFVMVSLLFARLVFLVMTEKKRGNPRF